MLAKIQPIFRVLIIRQFITMNTRTFDQSYFLALPFDMDQLKHIQKCSASRIQLVSFKGSKALKSIDDGYQKIRVVVASLLIKIFSQFSTSNADRLQRLKKIIYSSKLEKITEERGIQREHLLKLVATELKKITHGTFSEMEIIQMFNCSPFVDEVFFSALREENPLILENDCEVSSWLDREMSIKVLWNEEYLGEEKEEEMCLVGLGEEFHATQDCKSLDCTYKTFQQYLRFSTNQDQEPFQISEIYDRTTKVLFSYPLSPQQKHTKYGEYISIQTLSPSSQKAMSGKENSRPQIVTPQIKLFEIGLCKFSNPNPNPTRASYRPKSKRETTVTSTQTIKLRRSKKNQTASSLWSLFCCGDF